MDKLLRNGCCSWGEYYSKCKWGYVINNPINLKWNENERKRLSYSLREKEKKVIKKMKQEKSIKTEKRFRDWNNLNLWLKGGQAAQYRMERILQKNAEIYKDGKLRKTMYECKLIRDKELSQLEIFLEIQIDSGKLVNRHSVYELVKHFEIHPQYIYNWLKNKKKANKEMHALNGNIKIQDLIDNVPIDYYDEEPILYMDEYQDTLDYDILFDGRILTINQIVDGMPGFWRVQFDLQNPEDREKLNKLRHEIVSSMMEGETDVPLWLIAGEEVEDPRVIWHKLTPDYYCAGTQTIGELGTHFISEERSLKKKFDLKVIKYKSHMEEAKINRYYIFVVSPNSIMSNYPMTPLFIRTLCARMRMAISIEAGVEKELGYSPFTDDSSNKISKHIKSIIESISAGPRKQLHDFNDEVVFSCSEDPTEEEIARATSKIQQTWIESQSAKRTPVSKLEKWISNMSDINETTLSKKRLIPFPIILQQRSDQESEIILELSDFDQVPLGLRETWQGAVTFVNHRDLEPEDSDFILETFNTPEDEVKRHKNRKLQSFEPLSYSEQGKIYNAKAGLFAKHFNHPEVEDHEIENRKSISLDSDVSDIDEFIYGKIMTGKLSTPYTNESIDLLEMGKRIAEESTPPISSLAMYKEFHLYTAFCQVGNMITDIMLELSLSVKHINRNDSFAMKRLKKHKCWIIIHNTGSLLIFSLCFDKSRAINLTKGKIGPEMFTGKRVYVSDWCCLSRAQIEHYLKAQPIFEMCLTHQLSISEIDVTRSIWPQVEEEKYFWPKIKIMLLQFLVSKRDAEATVSCTRYLYMNILDTTNKDPVKHLQNFPDVLRSRFTVWLVKKHIKLMRTYIDQEVVLKNVEGKLIYENLIDWRTDNPFSLEEAVDSFYHGYLSSKAREANAHTAFKICAKLFKEEYKYRKLQEEGNLPIMDLNKPTPHSADKDMLKYFTYLFGKACKTIVGVDYKEVFYKSFIEKLRRFSFNEASTLKATARLGIHEVSFDGLNFEDMPYSKASEELKKSAPKLFESRHKVIEGLNDLIEKYNSDIGKYPSMYAELIPYCLNRLEAKDGFDSDLFPKSQHEKDREVHVLEIDARVIQSAIEMLSRAICEFFVSETMTHPEQKNKFVKDHYRAAGVTFAKFVTLCKSADASTWCQNHHCARFAAMLISLTPKILHGFIYRILALWVEKRVTIPSALIVNFIANRNLQHAPDIWVRMRNEMLTRTGLFEHMPMATCNIRSGMFQGILHYTSSVYHTMVQTVMKDFEKAVFERETTSKMIVTKTQSSDDSGSMNSFPITIGFKDDLRVALSIMRFKENVASWLGIVDSRKTAISTPFLIEYNSEWHLREKSIKPTFRWVAASSTLSVNETFINRYREFSNLLTSVLESGGTTLETSLLQLSQATFHYKLMGSSSNLLFNIFNTQMLKYPDPTLGFMPLSSDLVCGALGFDYDLYKVAKKTEFGPMLVSLTDSIEDSGLIDYEGMVDERKKKVLRTGGKFSFNETRIWQSVVKRMQLQDKDELIQIIEDDPEIIFGMRHEWESQKISIALKMYSGGVRASLNGHSPLIKMASAASYMLNRRFIKRGSKSVTDSLLHIILETDAQIQQFTISEEQKLESLKLCFPLLPQYKSYDSDIKSVNESMIILDAGMKHKSRVILTIFDTPIPGSFSLMELCKRKWFGKRYNLPLGETSFKAVWDEAKENFGFISDTLEETKQYLGMNCLQLKVLLESVQHKTRKIKLQDTQGKSGSTFTSLLRVYWPKTRVTCLITDNSYNLDVLLSNLFMLCAGPFTNDWSSREARRILEMSTFLDDSQLNATISHKLKIMRRAVLKYDKMVIIEEVKNSRLGVLGFYSVRQQRNSTGYFGPGEWTGIIGSTSVQISILDKEITGIKVNSLSDPDFLGRSLFTLIKEIGGETFAKKTGNCNIQLTKTGKLRQMNYNNINGIGLSFDREFKIEIFEKLQKDELEIQTSEFGLRLVSVGVSRSVTMLSVTMKNSYWLRECKTLVVDKLFEHFHSDTPLLFSDVLPQLSRTKSKQIRGHLDGKRLKRIFERELGLYEKDTEEELSVDDSGAILRTTISDEELKSFMMLTNSMDLDETKAMGSWADAIDQEEEGYLTMHESLLSPENYEIEEYITQHACGLPSKLRVISIEMSYRSAVSRDSLAKDLLINGRTDLSLESSLVDLWTLITGRNQRDIGHDVMNPPPSLSAISGAMSEAELIRNISLLQNSAYSDIYAMRDNLLSYNERLLEAVRKQEGKMPVEDQISSNLKQLMDIKNIMRFAKTLVILMEELGEDKIDTDTVLDQLGLIDGFDLNTFDTLSKYLDMSIFVKLESDQSNFREFDCRDKDTIESDPDRDLRVVITISKIKWTLEYCSFGTTIYKWSY